MAISGKTQVIGLIGWPVAHSFSPRMHNAAARALGLDLVYVPLPVQPSNVEEAVHGLSALGLLGANVTIPHKQTVMPFLDEVTVAAQAIGAVNTIRVASRHEQEREEGTPATPDASSQSARFLIGDNTDWRGLLADLTNRRVAITGRECVILGAGGAARAAAYALAQVGGRVVISARRREQAQALVDALAPHLPERSLRIWPWARRIQAETGALIVNATPVGMHPHEGSSPWPEGSSFPEAAFVYDLIYNPAETRLLRAAEAAGCRTANGLGMLLYQGALAFELWTGYRPEIEVMAAAIPGIATGTP